MDFLIVPLLAIALASLTVHTMAALVFHIHLPYRLLAVLVGFAWLSSLVLPELFFHTAGFWGSMGVSLIGAAAFAWLTVLYDTRRQVSCSIPASTSSETLSVQSEPEAQDLIVSENFAEPELEPDSELAAIPLAEPGQPVSDSLGDLLDFAFTERERGHSDSALETFRLIKCLYGESAALPLVVAEIVSTLQSQGDYEGAATELAEFLHLVEIRQYGHTNRIFGQKLAELQTESAEKGLNRDSGNSRATVQS